MYLPIPTIPSVVSVYQLVRIYMAPGIEPGNLIRSTLIRSPPGAGFFLNLVIRLHALHKQNITENIVMFHLCEMLTMFLKKQYLYA